MNRGVRVLGLAYRLGALVDFLVFRLWFFHRWPVLFWGFESFTEQYYFAMGNGAPLMLVWTLLFFGHT